MDAALVGLDSHPESDRRRFSHAVEQRNGTLLLGQRSRQLGRGINARARSFA